MRENCLKFIPNYNKFKLPKYVKKVINAYPKSYC